MPLKWVKTPLASRSPPGALSRLQARTPLTAVGAASTKSFKGTVVDAAGPMPPPKLLWSHNTVGAARALAAAAARQAAAHVLNTSRLMAFMGTAGDWR